MTPEYISTASHLPLLLAAVLSTTGHVVELGSGHYSTPALQAISFVQQRRVTTIDNDAEWLYRHTYTGPHTPILVDSWDSIMIPCEVAFVDVAPGEARASLIRGLRRYAKIIVVHDTEAEQRHVYPGVEEALSEFRFRVEDRRRAVWTTAVSDSDILYLQKAVE